MNTKQALVILLIIFIWAVRNRHECVTPDCTGLCSALGTLCPDCQARFDALPAHEPTYETDTFWEERKNIERDYAERPW